MTLEMEALPTQRLSYKHERLGETSDGINNHSPGSEPQPMLSARGAFEENIKSNLKNDPALQQSDNTYQLVKLPDGYHAWLKTRFSSSAAGYSQTYHIYGHPSGRGFDTFKGFYEHFKFLHGLTEKSTCECWLCGKDRDKANWAPKDEYVDMMSEKLSGHLGNVARTAQSDMTFEQQHFASVGVGTIVAQSLVDAIWAVFNHEKAAWDPVRCLVYFKRVFAMADSLVFAAGICKENCKFAADIATDLDKFKTGWQAEYDAEERRGAAALPGA
ncbi:hypothetical protein CLAFUW4_12782 [Fulvia fulva]|nr:hypothetical protein CLAFUR4_12786 [Fulvia fulva]WPV20866.1 hypothetical protein CLAFUW4_12782 [Fulvia fulva]